MPDALDVLIERIIAQSEPLSAETLNDLHAARSAHVWCRNKSLADRLNEVRFLVGGHRGVPYALQDAVHELARRSREESEREITR